MNISEFIEYLEEVRAEHGDLDVKIDCDYYGFEEVSWDIEQVVLVMQRRSFVRSTK